jgi:acetone carboxylase, alpha subunit
MVQTVEKEGLGWGNKTLSELLEIKEKLYQEGGYYFGLKDLPLSTQDPMKLELLHSRLLSAAIAGRETTRMVSASPQVREVAELAVALYTPEGDCILQSTGIIIHIPLMGQVIQWMIKHNYEDEGIQDGDCYTSNDCAIAGMHSADIYDIQPIFHGDKLIGWVGCVIMEAEIGALSPGCMPCGATERFVDGIKFTAEKSAANDVHLKSFERRVRYGLRNPDLFLLDRKGALAADIKVRREISRIIEDFGIDYYMQATRELIEMERRTQIERVKRRTVPGKFHSPSTIEVYMTKTIAPPHHAIDRITLVPWDFHIKADGTYFLDFDGAGAWGWHVHNSTPSSLMGAACMIMTQTISYTGKSNQGTFLTVGMNTPFDTFVNPASQNISTCNLFAWPENGGPKVMSQQSHAFFCRGFLEEVRSGNTMCGGGAGTLAGKDHFGKDYSFLSTEPAGAMGGGAFAIRDGIIADAVFMPDTDMGNVEIWELMLPMLWLGRKVVPDSCGWGKYRSGFSMLSTFLIYKTPVLAIENGPANQNDKIYPYLGMFGGYPGPSSYSKLVLNTNMKKLIQEKQPLPHGEDKPEKCDLSSVTGKYIFESSGNSFYRDTAKDGDIWRCFYGGSAAGFGDPIKRDTRLIKKDLDNNLLSIEICRQIFGVEATYDPRLEEWTIDEKRTAELRANRRRERIARGLPAGEWWKKRRQDIVDNKMPILMRKMYNESLTKGKRWSQEYRDFWHLEKDFSFKES